MLPARELAPILARASAGFVLDKNKKHEIDVLIDDINLDSAGVGSGREADDRLVEGVARALRESDGLVRVALRDKSQIFSARFACPDDGFSYPEVEPRLFSFNSPYGACEVCHGLGTKTLFGDELCDACGGKRLRPEALNVLIADKNIVDVSGMSIKEAGEFFKRLKRRREGSDLLHYTYTDKDEMVSYSAEETRSLLAYVSEQVRRYLPTQNIFVN